jgi:hypothetical protein
MAKLWDKFLVQRRDGTVPEWPYLVLGARDPAVPAAIRALADEYEHIGGYDPEYIADLRQLADEHEQFRAEHGEGDPDAPAHRKDDHGVVSKITYGTVNFRNAKETV